MRVEEIEEKLIYGVSTRTKNKKQKIIPDGCIEMTFNFDGKIKR